MIERIPIEQAIAKYLPLGESILSWMNAHPEVSGQEKQTSAFLVHLLRTHGLQVTSPIKRIRYSFLAKFQQNEHSTKPRIAILCEYDAMEQLGHSCGHSASCAASIVSALALQEAFPDLPFQIELIGTPNEEIAGGKIALLTKGIFDCYAFAALTQMGPQDQPCFQTLAASDLIVHYYGQAAHASVNPWEGINALNGVQLFFHALDMLRPHLAPGSQVNGIIRDGGQIPNVIPDQASAYLYLRAQHYHQILQLRQRIENCVRGAATATETKSSTEQLNPTYAEVFCSKSATELVTQIMHSLSCNPQSPQIISGSSDVGNISLSIPVFYPMISIGEPAPLYSAEFAQHINGEPGKRGMKNGVSVLAHLIVYLAEHPMVWQTIAQEHAQYRAQIEML